MVILGRDVGFWPVVVGAAALLPALLLLRFVAGPGRGYLRIALGRTTAPSEGAWWRAHIITLLLVASVATPLVSGGLALSDWISSDRPLRITLARACFSRTPDSIVDRLLAEREFGRGYRSCPDVGRRLYEMRESGTIITTSLIAVECSKEFGGPLLSDWVPSYTEQDCRTGMARAFLVEAG